MELNFYLFIESYSLTHTPTPLSMKGMIVVDASKENVFRWACLFSFTEKEEKRAVCEVRARNYTD